MLYYFNFVQTEYFKEADPAHRSELFKNWCLALCGGLGGGYAHVFDRGCVISLSAYRAHLRNYNWIGTGNFNVFECLANYMAQPKIVIASANAVAEGNDALPEAAAAAPKAALASRTNTLFSAPMLFMMFASGHLSLGSNTMLAAASGASIAAVLLIIILLEINAIFGKQGPLTSVSGVIHCGLGLTAVFYLLMALLAEVPIQINGGF